MHSRQERDSMLISAVIHTLCFRWGGDGRILVPGRLMRSNPGAWDMTASWELFDWGVQGTLEQAQGLGQAPTFPCLLARWVPAGGYEMCLDIVPRGHSSFWWQLISGFPVPVPEVWWHSGVCSPAHHLISHQIPGTLPAGSECSTWVRG